MEDVIRAMAKVLFLAQADDREQARKAWDALLASDSPPGVVDAFCGVFEQQVRAMLSAAEAAGYALVRHGDDPSKDQP